MEKDNELTEVYEMTSDGQVIGDMGAAVEPPSLTIPWFILPLMVLGLAFLIFLSVPKSRGYIYLFTAKMTGQTYIIEGDDVYHIYAPEFSRPISYPAIHLVDIDTTMLTKDHFLIGVKHGWEMRISDNQVKDAFRRYDGWTGTSVGGYTLADALSSEVEQFLVGIASNHLVKDLADMQVRVNVKVPISRSSDYYVICYYRFPPLEELTKPALPKDLELKIIPWPSDDKKETINDEDTAIRY